jgi:hypothetical protein
MCQRHTHIYSSVYTGLICVINKLEFLFSPLFIVEISLSVIICALTSQITLQRSKSLFIYPLPVIVRMSSDVWAQNDSATFDASRCLIVTLVNCQCGNTYSIIFYISYKYINREEPIFINFRMSHPVLLHNIYQFFQSNTTFLNININNNIWPLHVSAH